MCNIGAGRSSEEVLISRPISVGHVQADAESSKGGGSSVLTVEIHYESSSIR
jgi:hypothetical protein